MPRRKKVITVPTVRIDVEGMQGFYEVQRFPEKDDYWSFAYRIFYNETENHKGYKRHRTVTVSKRSTERMIAANIRYGIQSLHERIFGWRYGYNLRRYNEHRFN